MAGTNRGKTGKVVLVALGVVMLGGAGTVSAMATRYVPRIQPGTMLGDVALGGLTKQEAEVKVKEWWSQVSSQELKLRADDLSEQPKGFTPASLGITCDFEATLNDLTAEDFWANTVRQISKKEGTATTITPVLKVDENSLQPLATFVNEHVPAESPAKVDFVNGRIERTPEKVGLEFDAASAKEVLTTAVLTGAETQLPVKKAAMTISDEDLAKITEVVSTFTTKYNEGNANRSHNIKNAAQRLSGTILMPGQTFSFNKVLGQRTAKNGFKLAGVYNNGRHDFDIGGGICQVSSTLYNSVLLANLKINTRSCHTFPVPYVPVGRDATVSFPGPDFAFTNSLSTPIALAVKAGGGQITFRVLGVKDPSLDVKIQTAGHTSWSRPVKEINDPSLPPGRRVVEEPGGAGHRISTFRVIYRDGKEVERQDLGVSLYNGGSRIVRVNRKAPSKVPAVEVPGRPVDDESPTPPTGNPGGDGAPSTDG